MSIGPRSAVPLLLAPVLLLFAACDGGEDLPTGPAADAAPPEIQITNAPTASQATHSVTLAWSASDDRSLQSVAVDWGEPGALAVERIPASGRNDSGSLSHTYGEIGAYTITVEAQDAAGNSAIATHEIGVVRPVPARPLGLAAEVEWNVVRLEWKPGAWATSQEVVVSRTDGLEEDRVRVFADGETSATTFLDLTWHATYSVRVTALNDAGRTESAPRRFDVYGPPAPVLTRFSAVAADPTCLLLTWSPILWPDFTVRADGYRVELRGAAPGSGFEALVPDWPIEATFCADSHPIVDGESYTAQVFSLIGDDEYASNELTFTVDFDPAYSVTGTWQGLMTLELVDDDGEISGTWTDLPFSGQLTGTRIYGAVEIHLDRPENDNQYNNRLSLEFTDPHRLEGYLWPGLVFRVVLEREGSG